MEVRPGYKQTEVGVIPDDWQPVKAGDIGRFRGGSGFPIKYQGSASGAYPFFKVSDMNNEGNETFMREANNYVTEPVRKQLGAIAFPAESIVFAKVGAAVFLERKKILGQASCLDNNMMAFVLDASRADYRFVHYLLLSIKLGNLVSTTALPSLNGSVLSQITFPLPSRKNEQRAIAATLSDVDALLSKLDQFIAKKRNLKQAAMQQLLTGKARLPGFSEEWETIQIGEFANVKTGPFGSSLHERDYAQEGTPIITVEHLGEFGITRQNLPLVSDEDRKRLRSYALEVGDIVFSRVGSVDRNALVRKEEEGWLFSGRLLRVRPDKRRVFAPYLSFQFHTEAFKNAVVAVAVGQTMASLNTKILRDLSVAIPTIDEQIAIATILSDMDTELLALESRRVKTRALKQAMMQELLTGGIRLI